MWNIIIFILLVGVIFSICKNIYHNIAGVESRLTKPLPGYPNFVNFGGIEFYPASILIEYNGGVKFWITGISTVENTMRERDLIQVEIIGKKSNIPLDQELVKLLLSKYEYLKNEPYFNSIQIGPKIVKTYYRKR